MKRLHTTLILVATLLAGCSSDPVQNTSYYLLNNSQTMPTKVEKKGKVVIVKVLELPEYLNQAQLVMQMNNHQLHYAHFHMWAEPLKAGFSKALLADLNASNGPVQYLADRRRNALDDKTQLYVQLDFFHASSESKVTLSGRYWFEKKEAAGQAQHPFYFDVNLSQDGYPHSVAQMRALVRRLAGQIISGG